MNVEIEPETAKRIERLLEVLGPLAPASAESIVHMALDGFLAGAGF